MTLSQTVDDDVEKTQKTEPDPLRLAPPHGVSRIDTLPVEFITSISKRPLLKGDVVAGRYELQRELGYGGMGQVFIAANQAMGHRVAIKVLKPDLLADSSFRKRFQQEAQAIAAIEHRNVARFIDLVVGDPTFLVMEFVPGPTLAAVLKEGRMDPIRAINITTRLCWALDAVHAAGIVHRDVKPANVVLAPDPELGEEPKLIDFGLAKLLVTNPEDRLTRNGQCVGTPHYMSPEQIGGDGVDARSDVYSLACVLYHLVAGRPPFGGNEDMVILHQQISRTPDPVRVAAPEAPAELEALLDRALAKDPKDRFSSMRDMAAALRAIDRRRSTGAPPKPATSMKWLVVAAAAPMVAAALFVAGTRWPRPAAAADPAHGTLLFVDSQPAGAAIAIDGRPLSFTTPHVVPVAAGDHAVKLTKAGRDPLDRTVHIKDGEQAAVELTLPEASHRVEVQTLPSGARVYLDGRLVVGQTPVTVTVTDDDFHELRFEKTGFGQVMKTLKPEDHAPTLSVELIAEKAPVGYLWIDSSRAARVFIDGKNTGNVAPSLGMRVDAGVHNVELRDAANQVVAHEKIEVAQGEVVHATLEPSAK
jgi:predicted Ser/Thr protein kinase